MPNKWYQDIDTLNEFGYVLESAEEFSETSDVLEYYNKPYKWNGEYSAWDELEQPLNENEEGWDEFVEFLSNRE